MCRVVNKYKEKYDVYIGRGSMLGNPYKIGEHGTRQEVIEKYRLWLWDKIKEGEITPQDLWELNGKRLGCFCAPQPCHGDVLVKAVKWSLEER